jgi:hypothetical protein
MLNLYNKVFISIFKNPDLLHYNFIFYKKKEIKAKEIYNKTLSKIANLYILNTCKHLC